MTDHLVVHGVAVPVAPEEVSATIWSALATGTYEAREARWALKAVHHHDRILELGSGLGVITSLLAGVEGVKIWAFEANPVSVCLAARVLAVNGCKNVTLRQGILTAGEPRDFTFYIRRDLWMSSIVEEQGDYEETLILTSQNVDSFVEEHAIDLIVMDIEGAEHELLVHAALPGVERVLLEIHDHLYGLAGVREITWALAEKGFAYDPRGSSGACVLFSRDRKPRQYATENGHEL